MGRTLEGNKCHQEMMKQARALLEKQGYEVVFSARVDSGVVDVLGIKNGKRVGIECQVIPNWKIFVDKIKRYSPFVSKLILAIPKNVTPRLAPEGVEVIKLDVERYFPKRVTIVLDDDVEELVRKQTRKKGDFSRIVNEALREKLGAEK